MGNNIVRTNITTLTPALIINYTKELRKFYEPVNLNFAYHSEKLMAIHKLKQILVLLNKEQLELESLCEVFRCSFVLIYYFGMRVKMKHLNSCCNRSDKRQFKKAETVFQMTMQRLLPANGEICVNVALKLFTEVELWPFESFVTEVLNVVLFHTKGDIMIFNLMLTDIHNHLFNNIVTARHRMRVMYELLNSDVWNVDKNQLQPFITRLLDFFAYSIDRNENSMSAYQYLRKGFDVCIRRIYERADNQHKLLIITTMLNWLSMMDMSDESLLEFSYLLNYTADLYHVKSYNDTLGKGLFYHLLSHLVASKNHLYNLVGCRLLRTLLDRKKNSQYLLFPKIFYDFSKGNLKVGDFDNKDKIFIRNHREFIHDFILKAFMLHCKRIINLCSIFSVICCLIIEVPCGLTAASTACLMMAVQEFALNAENLSSKSRYWIHAIVISVMSLICWIHKAPVLYQYVNNIVSRRAKEAPQLNPPIMQYYDEYFHKITWSKTTLYFEDWELRYGLWKHFQGKETVKLAKEKDKAEKSRA